MTDNIPNDANASNLPETPAEGQFDLDKIFGTEEGGEGSQGVVTKPDTPTGDDGLPPVESDIFDGVTSVGRSNFKGMNDNAPKNPQEVIKLLQSERDKALSQLDNWKTQAESWKTANDFLGELESDRDVRLAFMHELEPELVKPKNPYDLIQETLKEEFKEFTPNPDEANLFGSKTWMYNQRAQELLAESKGKYKLPDSLKGLREKRKLDSAKAQTAALKEKTDIMSKRSWDENVWSGFANWMQSSSGDDFAKIYEHLLRKSGSTPKSVATQRGFNLNSAPGDHFGDLDKFFGARNVH